MAIQNGEEIETEFIKIPMVDLPLGATEDRVCGTIDIEKALTEGHNQNFTLNNLQFRNS